MVIEIIQNAYKEKSKCTTWRIKHRRSNVHVKWVPEGGKRAVIMCEKIIMTENKLLRTDEKYESLVQEPRWMNRPIQRYPYLKTYW